MSTNASVHPIRPEGSIPRMRPPARLSPLRRDLAGALERGEFVLHHQPIVDLADRRVTGHEALLRWQHPEHGLLEPLAFLDLVLDTSLETPVTDWVLRQACHEASRRPPGSRTVNVNLSSSQIGRPDLRAVVSDCLTASGLDPSDLVLELTEDSRLACPGAAELLEDLHSLGVALAIDDFGTGFAGLSYLQQFAAISIVKLDRSFVGALGLDQVSEHIVTAVVDLTRKCGLRLVTEGVETCDQATMLSRLGVQQAQGFLFGQPAPYRG